MNKENFYSKIKDNYIYVMSIIEIIVTIFAAVKGMKKVFIFFFIGVVITFIITIVERKKRIKKHKQPIKIDNVLIESLFLADMQRTQMDRVCIYKAIHEIEIDKRDMLVTFKYEGCCISEKGEGNFFFNIGGDSACQFTDLKCMGYDLKEDPERKSPITPMLVSEDGLCKKVKLPLRRRLAQYDAFSVLFHYKWPYCIKYGKDYYASSLSFRNKKIKEYIVILKFKEIKPDWLRVYSENGEILKDLICERCEKNEYIYVDIVEQPSANSRLIYQFYRKEPNGEEEVR